MIGQTLGRYQIVERLGEGGMGVVFRANDPRLERDVALKVLKQDALHDEDSKRRFRLEARALSQLLHPNIATLFDFDSDRGVRDFLVLGSSCLANRWLTRSGTAPFPRPEPAPSHSMSLRASSQRMRRASSIVTSSQGTSSSPRAGAARCSTSVSPALCLPEAASLTQSSSISEIPVPLLAPCPTCLPSKCETVARTRVPISTRAGRSPVRDDDGEAPIRR